MGINAEGNSQIKISVIIPALNEEVLLPRALESVFAQNPPPFEIFVVDGGSVDRTLEIAKTRANVLKSPPMIAAQKNAGAASATGEVLLFLHADCKLETGAFQEIQDTIQDSSVVGGAFRLRVCGNAPFLDRYLSISGSINARLSGIYLGDHGIFCRRFVFEKIGGFPQVPLMYEFDFMKRLRSEGKVIQLKRHCIASARKFEVNGYFKTMLLMRALRTSYRLGLPTKTLQELYLKF